MPHVLLVDDEPNIVRIVKEQLEKDGYEVETTNSSHHAMAMLRENRPDILVTDYSLPDMNGFEVVGYLRQKSAFQNLPIIMLAPRYPDFYHFRAIYNYGPDVFIIKPFAPKIVSQYVAYLLTSPPVTEEIYVWHSTDVPPLNKG
jgi:two-component system alkaline phosphatase synthesis response regulator PhoP